jgi:sugar phosphate permease
MGLILRLALLVGGALAGLFVARDSDAFGVVQGMMAIAAIAAVVLAIALFRRGDRGAAAGVPRSGRAGRGPLA